MAKPASFPLPPLLGAAGLICVAFLAAVAGRVSGPVDDTPTGSPLAVSDLRFLDRADGAVLVYDADSPGTQPIAVETGQNGFLRGTLRGFARTRHADGIGDEPPFRLTAWPDGRLTLFDPSTGRHTDLEAFGSTNVLVFAHLLDSKIKTQQSAALAASPARTLR